MKKMKKLFSLALALVMVMGLTMVAGAAETDGDITIVNGLKGKTYNAYRIFDVTYDSTKTNFSYTLATNSPWMRVVEEYFTVTPTAANPDVSVAEVKAGFSAAAFAADLELALYGRNASEGVAAVAPTVTDTPVATSGELTADGPVTLETGKFGYYLVTGGMGSLCNLTNTTPTATIYDKNDKPTIEKEVDDEDKSVYVGQVLNYTITGKVPDTTGYTTYKYEIKDTMGKGLTYNKDVTVTVDRTTYAEKDVTITNTDDGFTVNIAVMNMQQSVGAEIRVNYSATVNKDAEDAPAADTTNNAELTYSSNPTTNDEGTHDSNVTVHTAKIQIVKYDGATATVGEDNRLVATDAGKDITYLSGAEFKLARLASDSEVDPAFAGYEYYVRNETTGEVTWTDDIDEATPVTTDTNGIANIPGLENGDYLLAETKAPEGFNLLADPIEVTVEANGPQVTVKQNVQNLSGAELPATGGIGTTIFTVTGAILMIGAAVLFLTKKRSEV